MQLDNASTIGVVEVPEYGLFDSNGKNWLGHSYQDNVLISKQVLLSSLRGEGFDAQLINLNQGDYVGEIGNLHWGDADFTKVYIGTKIEDVDASAHDAWGVTNNFSQNREITCMTIRHLAGKGRPVVAGGSDVIADPQSYLAAGAAALVLDKSGSANGAVMDYVLGRQPRKELAGVMLADSAEPVQRVRQPLSPEDWHVPDLSIAEQCLGLHYKGLPLPAQGLRMGSIISDIGCDRSCDFCQTPTYRLGYRSMSPAKIAEWAAVQKEAGAWAVMLSSDQFLGRMLKKGGRRNVLEIMRNLRESGLAFFWNNGIELRKMTLGRGSSKKDAVLLPDEELISSLMGWDGNVGCYFAYLPAERPVVGQENYKKLLPWREHCEIVKAIVRTGTAYIRYGLVIGFSDDSHETLSRLEDAVWGLYEELAAINPSVNFQVPPFSLSPIPGSRQSDQVRQSGRLRFDDPNIFGSIWMTSVDTHHLTYREVFEWQKRLTRIGRSRYMEDGAAIQDDTQCACPEEETMASEVI